MGRGTSKTSLILRRVLLLSLFVFTTLIFLIFKNISLKELIQRINLFWFLFLFVNMFVVILINGYKFKLLVNNVQEDISYKDALKIVLSSVFASNITPYYSGGIAAQIYLLKKIKNGMSSATLISISYTILTVIVSLIFAVMFIALPHPFLNNVRGKFLLSIIILAFTFSSIALFFMAKPEQTKRFAFALVKKFNLKVDFTQIVVEIDAFSSGLRFMLKRKWHLLYLILVSFTSQLIYEFIGIVSLKAIGVHFNFYEAFLTQIASNFLATVGLTPGGMGIVEGTYLLLFLPISHNFAPLQTFLFRMFSYYIPSIIGAFVFYNMLGSLDSEFLYN